MHISEQVIAELVRTGWRQAEPGLYRREQQTGGAFGTSCVYVRVDETGRWLERVDGWRTLEKDVDLRDFSCPRAALAEVLA